MKLTTGIKTVIGFLSLEAFIWLFLGTETLLNPYGSLFYIGDSDYYNVHPNPEIIFLGVVFCLLTVGIVWMANGLLGLKKRARDVTSMFMILSSPIALLVLLLDSGVIIGFFQGYSQDESLLFLGVFSLVHVVIAILTLFIINNRDRHLFRN